MSKRKEKIMKLPRVMRKKTKHKIKHIPQAVFERIKDGLRLHAEGGSLYYHRLLASPQHKLVKQLREWTVKPETIEERQQRKHNKVC
jgi:hypothetical protein